MRKILCLVAEQRPHVAYGSVARDQQNAYATRKTVKTLRVVFDHNWFNTTLHPRTERDLRSRKNTPKMDLPVVKRKKSCTFSIS